MIAVRRMDADLEVCLIRRKGSKAWGIPKGMVDEGDTHEETALNEALEEAGLRGRLIGEAVGTYEFVKWGRTLTVAVYLMEVVEVEKTWDEASFRQRRWIAFSQAASLLAHHPISPLMGRVRSLLADRSA